MKAVKEYLTKHWAVVILMVAILACLALMMAPHIWMGMYNFPSGDDYTFSINNHIALGEGNALKFVKSVFWDNPKDWAEKWESRWGISILIGLSPHIFGAYKICTTIALGFLCLGQFVGMMSAFYVMNSTDEGYCNTVPIIALLGIVMLLQILYVPYPTATFYWWTGIAAYTIPYCLAVALLGITLRITTLRNVALSVVLTVVLIPVALLLAGTNYNVNIMTLSSLIALLGCRLLYDLKVTKDKKLTYKNVIAILSLIFTLIIGLVMIFTAPAMKLQLDSRYGGTVETSVFSAIASSVWITIKSMVLLVVNPKTILMLLIVLPFALMIVRKGEYKFYHPWFATIIGMLILASQLSVNQYVDGSNGGVYSEDVICYARYLMLVVLELYWVGYIVRIKPVEKLLPKVMYGKFSQSGLLIYVGILAGLLATIMYVKDLKTLSSYQAYNYVNNGWSQQYAAEWEERINVLEDPSVDEVVFEPIHTYGGYIQMYDLYESDSVAYWINMAVAEYYGKKSVDIKASDSINEY